VRQALTAHQLADFVADAVVAADANYRITYWNDSAARLFGWRPDEVLGQHAFELFRVVFRNSSLDQANRAVKEHGRWIGIVTQATKDGRTITCEAIVAGLPGADGYVIVLRDLAERQLLVEELQKAEERLAATLAFSTKLFDAAPVGILTYRAIGPCVSCNAAAAQILGGTVAQLQQQDFRHVDSWKKSELLALAERAIATREPQASELAMATTFGRNVWLLVRLAVFRSEDEDILLLVIGDITELKRVEEELRETGRVLRVSQRELRKLSRAIEQSPSSVIITNRDGNIEYVNPSFSVMSGYASEEVIGRNPRIFNSGKTTEDTYLALWATITSGGTWRGELCNKAKSGEPYWLRATISPILDDHGTITHFVAIAEHIGAQKAAEAAAMESERRFLGAQKMEAIGQLAGGIAHDFNNLLTAILGYSDFVAAAVQHDSAIAQDVEQIQKAGERAARLTRQLLAFSRKQRLEPQNINLNQIVDELVKMVGRVIGENIQLDVIIDNALGLAKLDPSQTEQVLMNLVVNARDAMPNGGHLAISTANVQLDESFIARHPGATPGEYVAVTVSDSGIGMSPEVLSRMFEPFFTTKAPGQGTGLGLATVYGIVKQSNGYITIESEPGVGTVITVYFPRLSAESVATEVKARRATPLRGNETILVAEDEAGLRQVVRRVLERYGYKILLASNGTEALAVEQSHPAPIDLLLSDVVMPELGGPDLVQRLSHRRPRMKVLYMSGFERRVAKTVGAVTPGVAFLAKPFTPEELARKIREVLDRPPVEPHTERS
jgi:PAS domain S-box-containing protein